MMMLDASNALYLKCIQWHRNDALHTNMTLNVYEIIEFACIRIVA